MTQAYVGIGSNLEDPRRQVEQAFEELGKIPRTRVTRKSSLYRSEPMGHADQPEFVNAVAELDSALSPMEILQQLIQIENRHGRKRSFPNAPRTLDLDLLLYGKENLQSENLTLPHQRMHERAFVLKPLLEIAPDAFIPGIGPARTSLERISLQKAERIGG
jgi:2-amino-4-hydroxy-6-hydroxymethyldihydropteridine diphosphokinase